MQRSVDNLNLAYVTFTRAKERLYIYAPKSGDSITTVSAALNKYIPSLSEFKANPEMLASGETIIDYVMGGDGETIYDTKDHADTIFEGGVESSKIMVEPQKISLRGSDEDDNIRLGVLYHELFSYIDGRGNTEGLIEEKVAKAVLKFLKKNPGTLLGDNFQTLEKDVLGKIFRVKEYGWFDEGKMVKNETSILSEKGMYRPDRVLLPADGSMDWAQVVDYKFGKFIEDSEENAEKVGYTHSDNVKQVGNYMKLLREMGYSDVKGWLWYVLEDKVEEVKGD